MIHDTTSFTPNDDDRDRKVTTIIFLFFIIIIGILTLLNTLYE